MLEQLRVWLNGSRDYDAGVILYQQVGDNKALATLFAKGKTDYCHQRLQDELMRICKQLKAGNEKNLLPGPEKRASERNEVLYTVCKSEADKAYKEVMNLRAEVFASARADDYTDPNTPDKIEQRSQLAVKVAEDFKKVSQLYERADYVKLHGRLPTDGEPDTDNELSVDGLPEHLVKQTLDNLRKNYNKMKKRPATPERVELLQKHEGNLKKLEARWKAINL